MTEEKNEPESVNEEKPKKIKVKMKGEPMDPDEISEKIEKALKNAGIEDMDLIMAKVEKAMEGIDEKVRKVVAKIEKEVGDIDVKVEVDTGNGECCPENSEYTKNVGILNLKDITEEELDKMKPIKNVGIIIVPEKFIGKMSTKIKSNVGLTVPYKEGWRLFSGSTEIDAMMLDALDEPIEFIQVGSLRFKDDVTPELVKSKIKAFHNYGSISAPEHIYGAVMAKCMENHGSLSKNGKSSDEDD
jgi:hypothetical protein